MSRDEGATLVEFAFASVLLFSVVFGIVNFGLAIWQYNFVSGLAQEGARWASVRSNDSATTGAPATAGSVEAFVQGRSMGINPTVTTTWSGGNTTGQIVTVTVETTFSPLTGLVPQAALTLRGTSTMVIAR